MIRRPPRSTRTDTLFPYTTLFRSIGTLVERTTRFTMLIHLPREDGYGVIPRTKNGPALAGHGAITMKNALAASMATLPTQLRRSLTWDRGKELSADRKSTRLNSSH